MDYFLGIDCGGTFIKAAIFDQQGKIHACERENVDVLTPKAGYAERDMQYLWRICANVIQRALQIGQIPAKKIKCIGISAQGKGAFLLDKQHQPLGHGILSSDQRAAKIVQQWQQQGLNQKIYPLSYQGLWTGHPVSILRWLKLYEPKRYEQIGSVLMSHDYLRFCLTGELYCEESNISESNLYNLNTEQYDLELANYFGIPEIIHKLPPIIKSNQIAGYVTPDAAGVCGLVAGIPVCGGVFDVTSMTLCLDQHTPHKLNVILGTWSIVTGISDRLELVESLPLNYGKYIKPQQFMLQEASPTSAGNLEWFINHWKLDYGHINQLIETLEPASSTVIFFPFLYGSNTKLGMAAGFYGVQAYHTQAHLLQAIYEGVLFSLMFHLERMEQKFPNVTTLRVAGGPTKSNVWMQMLADLSGKKLEIPDIEEMGCLGAILMAAESVNSSSVLLKLSIKVVTPNPTYFEAYREKYQKYKKLLAKLEELVD